MRDTYSKIVTTEGGIERLAVLDLSRYGENTVWVNRINVPEALRGKGIGSLLMEEMLYDADRTKVNVCLVINASGRPRIDPDTDQLAAWYTRCGFKCRNGLWFREPAYGRVPSDYSIRQDSGRVSLGQWNELVGRRVS